MICSKHERYNGRQLAIVRTHLRARLFSSISGKCRRSSAQITAERLVQHLTLSGFVVMKKSAARMVSNADYGLPGPRR